MHILILVINYSILVIPLSYFIYRTFRGYHNFIFHTESVAGSGVLKAYKVNVRINHQSYSKRIVAIVNQPFKDILGSGNFTSRVSISCVNYFSFYKRFGYFIV